MTRSYSYRPMTRAIYQAALAALKSQHPWLVKQVVELSLIHI